MFDFLEPVVQVFDFIFSLLDTIIQGVYGTVNIITSLVQTIINITKILPNPIYPCFLVFMNLYLTIFIFKIFRKG